MSSIIPDNINDLTNNTNADVPMIHQYIMYMHEMIDFWATNRMKDIDDLKRRVAELEEGE